MNTIKKNAYRMLVLAVMTLLMAVNLSQTAFACLTSGTTQETTQNKQETTKNPMECLVYEPSRTSTSGYDLTNICDEALSIKLAFEEDIFGEGISTQEIGLDGRRGQTIYNYAVRWAVCFDGERIEGLVDYWDTSQYSCVAE